MTGDCGDFRRRRRRKARPGRSGRQAASRDRRSGHDATDRRENDPPGQRHKPVNARAGRRMCGTGAGTERGTDATDESYRCLGRRWSPPLRSARFSRRWRRRPRRKARRKPRRRTTSSCSCRTGCALSSVDPETAPAMAAVRDKGVNFANATRCSRPSPPPSLGAWRPATSSATPAISATRSIPASRSRRSGSVTPFLENDPVLGEVDEHFGGNYLNEETMLKAARDAGLQHRRDRQARPDADLRPHRRAPARTTIIVDDATGSPNGMPLSPEIAEPRSRPRASRSRRRAAATTARPAMRKRRAPRSPTSRSRTISSTSRPRSCCRCSRRAASRSCWSSGRAIPTAPSTTRATASDALTPGINGPTSLAAIRNADNDLAQLRDGLGRSRARRDDRHHRRRRPRLFDDLEGKRDQPRRPRRAIADVPRGLPAAGFVALDLARRSACRCGTPTRKTGRSAPGTHPRAATALHRGRSEHPAIVVAANGGSDLIYLPDGDKEARRSGSSTRCSAQDYVSGLFVDDELGLFPARCR